MQHSEAADVTRLLRKWKDGDERALEELYPMVESNLQFIARNRLRSEDADRTLDTVGLVSELYIRLTGDKKLDLDNRRQFFKAAAVIMKHIVVDHARKYRADKRGRSLNLPEPTGGLDSLPPRNWEDPEQLLALDHALEKLKKIDPNGTLLVEMRFFLGLNIQEVADQLNISTRTVRRNLDTAKAWLNRELSRS